MQCRLSNVRFWHNTDIHIHFYPPPYPPTATLADSPATSSTPSGNLSI